MLCVTCDQPTTFSVTWRCCVEEYGPGPVAMCPTCQSDHAEDACV